MNNELKIAAVLKQLIKEKGETLASVSTATGVPKSTISDWMTNRTPNPMQVVKVAHFFGVSLHFLLFGKEDIQTSVQRKFEEDFFSGIFEINIKRVGRTNKGGSSATN